MSTAIPAAIQILTRRRDTLAAQVAVLQTRLDELDGLIRVMGEGEPAAPAAGVTPVPDVAATVAYVPPPLPPGTTIRVEIAGADRPKPEARGTAGDIPAAIARALAEHGPQTPKRLAEVVGVTPAVAGYHLRNNPTLFDKVDPANVKSAYRATGRCLAAYAATAGGTTSTDPGDCAGPATTPPG